MKQGGKRTIGIHNEKIEGKPLVTIITAVFNGEKHLENTIKSVINQAYKNIEYLIIDGNSSDNTVEIIEKYNQKIDFWISEPDNGIYEAFNKGLLYATGDYIGFINSDDWYEPNSIEKIVLELKPYPAIYCGNMNLCGSKDGAKIMIHKSRPDRLFQTMRIAHPATFVSRHIFNTIGGFSTDYKIAGDYDFLLRAKLRGFEIIVVDQIISNMLLGGISKDLLRVYKEERIIKNKNIGHKPQHLIWYLANVILHMLSLFIKKFSNRND
jgi:glycosyltransferase involved in cell wall biosynthesis